MSEVSYIDRITFNPKVMGGRPCIRGMRVTAGMILGLLSTGVSHEEILADYPYLEQKTFSPPLNVAASAPTAPDRHPFEIVTRAGPRSRNVPPRCIDFSPNTP